MDSRRDAAARKQFQATMRPGPSRTIASTGRGASIRLQIDRAIADQAPPYPPVAIQSLSTGESLAIRLTRAIQAWLGKPAVPAHLIPSPRDAANAPWRREWLAHRDGQTAPSAPKRGATPTHWRAFSIIQSRNDDRELEARIDAFRQLAKQVKTINGEARDACLAVLDAFVTLVDAYRPLWDATKGVDDRLPNPERDALERRTADSVAVLARQLQERLDVAAPTSDAFDTAERFIETRYGGDDADYGLKPIA